MRVVSSRSTARSPVAVACKPPAPTIAFADEPRPIEAVPRVVVNARMEGIRQHSNSPDFVTVSVARVRWLEGR